MCDLTIVVAIYNVDKYLDKCLESLSKQSHRDYKVYCVNDGSSDNSRDIILKYVNNDKRFELFDKKNGGLSDARNYGLVRCNTKYISFVDGDDFVSFNYVESILKEMDEKDLDMLVFSYNQFYLVSDKKEKIDLRIKEGIYNLKDNKKLLAYTPNAAWNKAYKTSLFKDNDIVYPFAYRHQDLGTTPKLLLRANRIAYLDLALYNYLIDRPNNITAQIDNKLYHIVDMAKEVMDYYKRENVFDEYVDEFEYLIKRNFIQSLRKAMKLKDICFVYKFIDDIFKTQKEYFKNSGHKYKIDEEKGDNIYLSKNKCKFYYLYRKIRGIR